MLNSWARRIMRTKILFLMSCSLFLSCDHILSENNEFKSIKAKYVLPYPVGKVYFCSQGFNSSFSHYNTFQYAIDFDMPIGTLVTAARSGRVVYIVENYSNNDHVIGHENVVIVMHTDSTYARYTHLTTFGAIVKRNQLLMPGDSLGFSGSSGESNHPHLHFDVTKTFTGRFDMTIPVDFINTSPRPVGLNVGFFYKAFHY
jgi:murein DD-endopeptidase MepM/ murein hydrolase activator NlpD